MKLSISPGEILLQDYRITMGISPNALARALGISPQSINEIVLGRRSITPEMSLKLGTFFKTKCPILVQHSNHLRFAPIAQKRKPKSPPLSARTTTGWQIQIAIVEEFAAGIKTQILSCFSISGILSDFFSSLESWRSTFSNPRSEKKLGG